MIKNTIKESNLIVDVDEILCNISPLWVKKIIENKKDFLDYFDLSKIEKLSFDDLYSVVMKRKNFYLNVWLKKNDADVSESRLDEIQQDFFNLYDNDIFYTLMKPTEMGKSIAKVTYTNMVKKVYVVSRSSSKTRDTKRKFIEDLIPKSKLEIRFVDNDEKKSDYIKDIEINEGIVFEDEIKNINDYLDNTDKRKYNIYIPSLGYNQPTDELREKCKQKEVELIYY